MAGRSNNAVATQAQNSTALTSVDYGEYANSGFENTTQDDFAIPFLDILQGQSPEVESLDAAKPGMFHNTVTDDLFDGKEGISVVVCATAHEFVEWKPRNQGGGIVDRHAIDSELVQTARQQSEKFNELTTPDGNDLVETYYAYLILNLPDGPLPAVLSCSSTRIKPYKAMMTKANMIMVPTPSGGKVKPPLFAHKFRLTTLKKRNADGEWFSFEVKFDSPDASAVGARLAPSDDLFQAAVGFNEVIRSGAFKTNEAGEAKSRANGVDENVPF